MVTRKNTAKPAIQKKTVTQKAALTEAALPKKRTSSTSQAAKIKPTANTNTVANKPVARSAVTKGAAIKGAAIKGAAIKSTTTKSTTVKGTMTKKAVGQKPTPSKTQPKPPKSDAATQALEAQMRKLTKDLEAQTAKASQATQDILHAAHEKINQATSQVGESTQNQQNIFNAINNAIPNLNTAWQQVGDTFKDFGHASAAPTESAVNANSLADIAKMIDPADLQRLQAEYFKEMGVLWQNYTAQQHFDFTDRRFVSPAWRSQSWANYLAQSYLINARLMIEMAECVKTDAKTKTRVRFKVMQWVDSVAPSNFFLTNPDAQQKLLDTKGESLKLGIQNFLTDLQKGRISQTDEEAFEVGVNVARSDGAVVFENQYFQLLQYSPLTETVGTRPLLIVPPCINKFYILDLQPDNSLVRHAVENGNTVYLVSWRNADESLSQTTWDDYIEHVLIQAIHVVIEASGSAKINALGFCVGGTLLTTALAVMAARGEDKVQSLTLLTTLLDFSDNGVLDAYVDEQQVVLREKAFAKGGVMQGKELSNAFATLRPNDLVWNYVVSNYLKGEQPSAFDLLYWNSDSTNLPGPMFCWYLRNTYLENRLKTAGSIEICGEKIDLKSIRVPTYILACRDDHIVPWNAAYRSQATLSGTKRFVLAASGHIAGVVNSAKKNKRNYWLHEAIDLDKKDSEQWLDGASEHAGSWWGDWSAWLVKHMGKQIAAPKKLGTTKFKPIEMAPGRYVKVRAA